MDTQYQAGLGAISICILSANILIGYLGVNILKYLMRIASSLEAIERQQKP